jgi:hypothetical protein
MIFQVTEDREQRDHQEVSFDGQSASAKLLGMINIHTRASTSVRLRIYRTSSSFCG